MILSVKCNYIQTTCHHSDLIHQTFYRAWVCLAIINYICPRTSPPGQQPANCYIESLDRKTALAVLLITLCVSKRHLSPWPVLLTSSFINPFDPSRPVCIRVFKISLSASWCMSLGLMRCRPGECTRGKLQFAMTE